MDRRDEGADDSRRVLDIRRRIEDFNKITLTSILSLKGEEACAATSTSNRTARLRPEGE